jgi:hypothetical protein
MRRVTVTSEGVKAERRDFIIKYPQGYYWQMGVLGGLAYTQNPAEAEGFKTAEDIEEITRISPRFGAFPHKVFRRVIACKIEEVK